MSNKLKINNVPHAMAMFICRQIHQGPMTPKQYLKGEKSLGFTRMAKKMIKLGYRPNYSTCDSTYSR